VAGIGHAVKALQRRIMNVNRLVGLVVPFCSAFAAAILAQPAPDYITAGDTADSYRYTAGNGKTYNAALSL